MAKALLPKKTSLYNQELADLTDKLAVELTMPKRKANIRLKSRIKQYGTCYQEMLGYLDAELTVDNFEWAGELRNCLDNYFMTIVKYAKYLNKFVKGGDIFFEDYMAHRDSAMERKFQDLGKLIESSKRQQKYERELAALQAQEEAESAELKALWDKFYDLTKAKRGSLEEVRIYAYAVTEGTQLYTFFYKPESWNCLTDVRQLVEAVEEDFPCALERFHDPKPAIAKNNYDLFKNGLEDSEVTNGFRHKNGNLKVGS